MTRPHRWWQDPTRTVCDLRFPCGGCTGTAISGAANIGGSSALCFDAAACDDWGVGVGILRRIVASATGVTRVERTIDKLLAEVRAREAQGLLEFAVSFTQSDV